MMQENIIKNLYINFIQSSEQPRRYYLLFERIDKNTKELKNVINKRNKKKLKQICDDYDEIASFEAENAFIDGFSFAVQLMSEAYARKQ